MPKTYIPVGPHNLTCVECKADYVAKMSNSKYCSKACARRSQARMPGRECTRDGCVGKVRAKGLCATHYNQVQPARYKRVMIPCSCCGKLASKESRSKRYARSYCSALCRDYDQWGPRTSKLPAGHLVYMVGKSSAWAPPKQFNCSWCDSPNLVKGNRDTYCSDPCRLRSKRARRRAREHGAHGTYTWGQVVRLWATFGKACAYCSQPTPLADIQPEHVTPLSRGGANNIGNLLPSCMPCNADKRDLLLHQWAADRQRRHLPAVTTTWDERDARYSHLAPRGHELAA